MLRVAEPAPEISRVAPLFIVTDALLTRLPELIKASVPWAIVVPPE